MNNHPAPPPDHPHARGENDVERDEVVRKLGPSPRAWGELLAEPSAAALDRTIPTRVGRTNPPATLKTSCADHPHARGENRQFECGCDRGRGPSPRAWGELEMMARRCARFRTIPTRVGRTFQTRSIFFGFPDHPHARGENATIPPRRFHTHGPSPRAWGEPRLLAHARPMWRTIPTRVGRTTSAPVSSSASSDHPHARGENRPRPLARWRASGPSPRAWGERKTPSIGRPRSRTIPTRVGRTLELYHVVASPTDHPHARGENRSFRVRMKPEGGPSPRAWGERCRAGCGCKGSRTIPTRVGRTHSNGSALRASSDHPHARGENLRLTRAPSTSTGPSPRAWGERLRIREIC